MTVAIVQGTRPEIIKNYSIAKALRLQNIPHLILHTNQHVEDAMRDKIYHDMGYYADEALSIPYSLGSAIEWLQKKYKKNSVKHVIVNGDTAASLAGALAALYSDIAVSHVEAGLRSRDIHMLEERNRIMVDAVSSLLFAYTYHEYNLLTSTPDIRGTVLVEGNTTVDVIHDFQHLLSEKPAKRCYLFVTLHRRELTGSRRRMHCVVKTLNKLVENVCDVIFPVHPRTKDALKYFRLGDQLSSSVQLIEPLSAIESLGYQKHARAVLTDSGCIQEEAYILGTPCVTLRENTERHLTVQHGANHISGFDCERIITLVRRALAQPRGAWPAIYGNPGSGWRIVNNIRKYMDGLNCDASHNQLI